MSKALTLEEMLIKNWHEVVEVLVGNETDQTLSVFFIRNIHASAKRFLSHGYALLVDNGRS